MASVKARAMWMHECKGIKQGEDAYVDRLRIWDEWQMELVRNLFGVKKTNKEGLAPLERASTRKEEGAVERRVAGRNRKRGFASHGPCAIRESHAMCFMS